MKWPLTSVLIKTYKEMEKIAKKKSWRTLVFALGVVLLVGGGIFITCQKEANVEVLDSQQDHGVEYPIPEGAKALIMDVHFYKDLYPDYEDPLGGKGDMLILDPAAASYYLPHDIKHYEEYARLIKGAGEVYPRKFNLLKITVGHDTRGVGAIPIIKVERPTQEEYEKHLDWYIKANSGAESTVSIRSARSLAVSMPLSRAQQFFSQFERISCANNPNQCPCIPFQYATDGCYARAHYMRKLKAWKEYPIPENAVVSLDDIRFVRKGSEPWEGWFDTKGKGDPVSFGGANLYYLPKDIKNYEYYRTLLQGDGISKYNILKYTLGEYDYEIGAYPIIRVELPKPADREWFERSYEPIQTSAARTRSAVTMTLARAR